ncbi:hypothetical protein [Bernardetia sp.]|uniref:hypothetical protein n=1 Tax=Bernardetia sp. TaxID=1937974 RepID=UPI0025BC592C|nr:hypothetical protein [Bernardetia sp.]
MNFFSWFKSKKTQNIDKREKELEKIELLPNVFNEVSERQFFEEVNKYFDLQKYGVGAYNDEKLEIFIGDLYSSSEINLAQNVLVVGNIRAKWINLTSEKIIDSGGYLFVTGNLDCDYFSNDFNKFVFVNGSLIVKKILNTEFEDSCLVVGKDLVTEYFHGIDIWAEVGGSIDINYGWGYCRDFDGKNVFPKNDIMTSLEFLGIDKDFGTEQMNELISKAKGK